MSTLAHDIETYRDLFYVGFKRLSDGVRLGFEISRRKNDFAPQRVRQIMRKNLLIGYNCAGYDLPMIALALELVEKDVPVVDVETQKVVMRRLTPAEVCNRLKQANDRIIVGKLRPWEVEKALDVRIPRDWDYIDLKEPQPNGEQTKPGESGGSVFTSLKTLNARLHGKRLQDLPYEPDARLTDDQIAEVVDYCLTSDLDATENLFVALKEPLELRQALGKEYGQDFRSKSDSQIGEAIVRSRVESLTKSKIQKVETPPGTSFRYPVPAFMKFDTPQLQSILDRVRETDFVVNDKGKVDLPKWLADEVIELGSSTYAMGIGGLHSTEANRAVHADEDFALVDADVASMYPVIILMLALLPRAIGKHFLSVYAKIKEGRIDAKARAKEIKRLLKKFDGSDRERVALEVELFACNVKDKGLKIALNGVFGKLGSRYSILYAPHLLLATTLTGQLTLLMLIERAVLRGIDVVSGNTDGVLFKVPRTMFDGLGDGKEVSADRLRPSILADICEQWERDTGFDLEFAEYRSIYNQSVNSYFAIKADGGHKRKGPLGNPWSKHADDFDPRAQLMKNPQATICSDAALALIKDGTPIEKTIYGCTDIRQFVTVIKSDGGATWRGSYLGKTVRYYWATDGDEILKAKPHATTGSYAKVPKTDGAAPCMTLPDELPDDIDYDRYISETREILMTLGHLKRPPPPEKVIRLTKANRQIVLMAWSQAA